MAGFLGIFVFAFVTGLSGALIPGPLLTFTIGSAAKRGSHVGALVVVGHAIFETSLIAAIFAGASALLQSQALLRSVGGAGAVVLSALGVKMLLDAPGLSLSAVLSRGGGSSKIENPVLGGLMMTAFNPTFPLWWATIGLALLARFEPTVTNVVVFYAGHILSDFAWYVFVSVLVGTGRRFVRDDVYRVFIAACGLFLIAFATYFAWSAVVGVRL